MSSATPTTTNSFSSSPQPTANNNSNSGGGNAGSFYKNLFYILIGLLCAFGLISFFSLIRARRRRAAILREAERLGVLVPGSEGYVPLRHRQHISWARADGTEAPDWWEVEGREKGEMASTLPPIYTDEGLGDLVDDGGRDFSPLAVISPPVKEAPIAKSELPFFPNHLAYRPSSLLPPRSRYQPERPETVNELGGEIVDVVTIIRMPGEPWPEKEGTATEEQAVVKQWGGIEMGIGKFQIGANASR